MKLSPLATRLVQIAVIFSLLTYLGLRAGGRIDRDEQVAFHSPYLFWDEAERLQIVVRGRLFEPELDSPVRRMMIHHAIRPRLLAYLERREADLDERQCERMDRLLYPFLDDGESRVALSIRLIGDGGETTLRLPRTGSGGYFATTAVAARAQSLEQLVDHGKRLSIEAVMPARDTRRFGAELPVPPRRLPLLVVSDVDDTVRIAHVTERRRMIECVFLREYEPVPGMAPLYNELAQRGSWFHFVSGSPWQIGPEIERMLHQAGFPAAVLHCRQIGWDFWNSDPLHTKEFKVRQISMLLSQFRACPVLMIGDSGEHDPEVYSEVLRRYPDRVAAIWIRKVGPPWQPERLAAAAARLGAERALAFDEPAELERAARALPLAR